MASPIRTERRADPGADLLGIVLGEHPDVVDEVGEERGHDAPVAGLDRRAAASAAGAASRGASWAPH